MKITIDGNEYPVLMGRGAMRMYARKKDLADLENTELVEIIGKMSINDADLLNWCCLKAGCSGKKIDFPYTFEEFQELMSEQPHLVDELDEILAGQTPQAPKKKGKAGSR